MLAYTTRPISDRTAFTGKHEMSRFTVTWTQALALLQREFDALDGHNLVIEVDVPEAGIRNDGLLRADAKAASPAARIAFESRHGPLIYATDRYVRQNYARTSMADWQHNVYAIALGLEALRKVDRYGVSRRGEQYTGYKAIGAGAGQMTKDEAMQLLQDIVGVRVVGAPGMDSSDKGRFKTARALSHPDRHGGDRGQWDQVEQAGRVLGLL